MLDNDYESQLLTLEAVRRARHVLSARLCEASRDKDEGVLEVLRLESMFEFSEFYFVLAAMGLNEPDDIALIAEMHNQRIKTLLEDPPAMRRRKLRSDRLRASIFTSATVGKIDCIWREAPGSLDQSTLARLLIPQLSIETTRKLAVVSERAGFLLRRKSQFGSITLTSNGIIEQIFGTTLGEMRREIQAI